MSTSLWTMVVGAVAGLALAAYGTWMLTTGRAPTMTARAFRSVRDAGFYHLLFGVALALVVLGTGLDRSVVTTVTTLVAVVLVGLAMVRFRPRGRRPPPDGDPGADRVAADTGAPRTASGAGATRTAGGAGGNRPAGDTGATQTAAPERGA